VFTGIVEEVGIIREASPHRLVVSARIVLSDLAVSQSIAVNGACLTVVDMTVDGFAVDLSEETLSRTNLGRLMPGRAVNLERSLAYGARVGGHLVQGHVDGVGTLSALSGPQDERTLVVETPPGLARYIVEKGFVTVDGISLTVTSVCGTTFSVAVIPYTYEQTTLRSGRPKDLLNLETDILAKYVEQLIQRPVQ
jgi:riboflavin synthase